MSYNDSEYYDDGGSERHFEEGSTAAGAPSQLLSPTQTQGQTATRYSASLSASSLIESLDNDQDDDSVASIDVHRVGFTPRTSVALTDADTDGGDRLYADEQDPHAHDPYARHGGRIGADDSMDERDVEAMLLEEQEQADRSLQYDDVGSEQSGEQYYQQQYGDEDFESEEDLGFLQQQPQEWSHVLSVDDVRARRTKALSTIAEVRSSIGSRSQVSQSQFSPRALSEDAPPAPRIPSMYRQQTTGGSRPSSWVEGQGPSPPASLRSHHSRASTDPGAAPPIQLHSSRSMSPVKSVSSASSLGVRDRIAMFEGRTGSPAPIGGLGLVHGARPGSPSGTHGLGLGLGLSLTRSPAPPSTLFSTPGLRAETMLSTPFSPAQSMPPMSPPITSPFPSGPSGFALRYDDQGPRSVSYHSSQSSRSRPASPVKSVKSYQSEGSSVNVPSYASSHRVQPPPPQAVSSENLGLAGRRAPVVSQESLGHQPQPGTVQRVLASLGPRAPTTEQDINAPGLWDVRRRQSLRRASGGGSGHGHEPKPSSGGSGGRKSTPSAASAPSQASGRSRPRSEGGSGDGSVNVERTDGHLTTSAEEPLRVGNLWYLHVHTGDERFRWIKCKAVLFRSQLQLTWVEAGGGKAIIGLDLLNCHEVRSVPSPNHASAWEDIGNVAARAQALDEGGPGGVEELCPFQMMYEDGVERLGAGSPRERMKWVGAIWDALNRASVVPSRTSSPAQSIGTIPSQHSHGSGTGSGSGSRHGSASTVFIPPDEEMPDIGSTISSLSRSSFRSVPIGSPYQTDSFHSARRPRSIDDASLPSRGQEFLSPADARIAIAPSRSSSLRRTSSMTDLDEYASAAAPASESQSEFDLPFLPSRGPSSAGSKSYDIPRTIHSGSSVSSASGASPSRPLPNLPTLSSIPSMPSMRSMETGRSSDRYGTATSAARYDTATDITVSGTGRYNTASTPTARRATVSTTSTQGDVPASSRRYDTPLGTTRSASTIVPPPAVASLRPPSAPPTAARPASDNGSVTSSFLTAPSARTKTPVSRDPGSTTYGPHDDGPVRRIRTGKASSVYSLSSVNEQERHRQAAEDSSTVDEYGSMLSSPAPSMSSVGTPKFLGTTALPRLAFRGPDSGSMLGDSHVGGSPGTPSTSSSSHTSETSRSYATPRTPSRLSRVSEHPTGTSATSLVRAVPGARPKSSRFPAPKSSATSAAYLTAEDKENTPEASSSESYVTASERTPTKSTYSADSVTSEPLSLTQEAATAELARSETEVPPSEIGSMHTDRSDEEIAQFDPEGAARLSRVDSYYTTTSAGLARAGSIAGGSEYSTIAYDVCLGSDISEITPLSGSSRHSVRSVTPTPAPSTPYQSAPEPPLSPMSMSSIPTIRTESQYATPDQVDSSTEYSSAMRWPSSTEYVTVPLASSPAQSSSLPPLPSSRPSSTRVSTPSVSTPILRSVRGTPTPSVVGTIPDAISEISITSATLSSESSVTQTPTQSRTMSLASRSPTASPLSTPKRPSAPRSISSQSTATQQPKSTTVSSVSTLSSTTASSVTASPLPTPMSASSRSLSSVTTSMRTPASFLMPPVPPPSSTRSTRSRPVSEVSFAASSQQSMASSLFAYTPSATSSILPGENESYDSSFLRPSVSSSDAGDYEIVQVESSSGELTPSSRSTSIPIAPTPSAMSSLLSPSSLTRSESVSSISSLRSSIFLPSRSSSIRSVAPTPSVSDMDTPRSPTVSVTMTPAQSFHPSFRDDLSTVPSEEEEALAPVSAPMEIISHDVNRLVQYLDGVDRQRVAEHADVKDQLDRVEEELKRLADFVRQEAAKPPPVHSPAETVQDLPEPTDDVVMHSAPRPAVILLDLPVPESPLKLSSGSVTESIAWLSSPSSVSEGLPVPPGSVQGSERVPSESPSSLTESSSLHPSDSASQRSASMSLPQSAQYSIHDTASQRSGSMSLPQSAQHSIHPSDSASQTASVRLSDSEPHSPHSEASTIRDGMSVNTVMDSGVQSSVSLPSMPPQSFASTPPPSIPGASPSRTPLSTPPRTRGGTPDIEIVSASGRGSPARSDITVRQPVSNAQLRDMLNDLRDQTNKLIAQQTRANDAIEELQNRPPIQLPPLPATPKTPRRSPYADLLSRIADTLKNIVEAGEAARDLPAESEPAESIADTEDSGGTIMDNLQNRLNDVLGMPVPPRQTYPTSTVGAPSVRERPESEAGSTRLSPPPASLYEQHVADFPRIHRPIPRRGRLMRSTSPRIFERPGTAPLPSGPSWGRPTTMYRTPAPAAPAEEESESRATTPRPTSGPDLDLLKLLQDKRRQRRGGDGTFIPGGDEAVEEYQEPPPRPETAPIEFVAPDEPVTKTWYSKRPRAPQTPYTMADPRHEEQSEPPSPPKSPAVVTQRRTPRPTIPLGELPSTASYAEMLALLRQNELMQRHQNEQQNELVRYLHDLNGWLARDVNNRQAELQGVEGRIAHLQNALAGRAPVPYPVYVPEQEPVMPLPSRIPSMRMPTRFGDPEGDEYIPPRMGRVPYGPPPGTVYNMPPPSMGYPGYPTRFGEPESPPIVPTRPRSSRMPIIEVRGADPRTVPSRRPRSTSSEPIVHGSEAPPPATVLDPASRHSPHSPPRSSRPPNVITIEVPTTTARSRSRSPRSRHHGSSRSPSHRHRGSSRSPSRRYRDSSRSPTRRYSRNGSHSPHIAHTASRPSRSSRRGETVVVHGEELDRGRSHSRSRSHSPVILPAPSARPSSHHGGRSERVVVMQQPQESRQSRSRSPRTVFMPAPPQESRRSRSRSPRIVMMPPPQESRRSRSRSPRPIMMPPPQESRRSRSPRTVIMPAPITHRRSRTPTRIVMAGDERSRSHSRERRRIVRSRRSRSRSRSPVIIQQGESRRRSRSPQVIIAGPSERPHSSQPFIIDGEGRRSRRGFMSRLFGGRSSPTRIIQAGSRRSRTPSPRRVLGRRRSRTPPIIINADPRRSRSPTRHHGSRRSRSRTPPVIISGSRRDRSRSPRRLESRRHHSRSPVRIFEGSRGGRSRSRSRSPHRRHSYSPRSRPGGSRHDPAEYDAGTRRHRGYSPRRSRSLERRLSRSPTRHSRSPTRRSHSLFGRGGSRIDPVDYDRGRRRRSPREGSRYGPEEYDRGGTRRGSPRGGSRYGPEEYDRAGTRRGSPRGGSRYGPEEYDRAGTHRGSPRGSRYDAEEFDRGTRGGSPRRRLERPGHSRYGPEEGDIGPPRSERPDSRRLTRLTVSPPRTRLTRRSRSRSQSASPEGTRAPRTHHSGRQSPPMTVMIPEEEEHGRPQSRPATRRADVLSTIHEGDSIRTSPSVIQVPSSRVHRGGTTLRVASPGLMRSTSPTIIRIPGEDMSRRGTPHMLRVSTPRSETPSNIIRLPSAPPQPPSRAQVLRVGTSHVAEPTLAPAPALELRARTPPATFIQIPGQPQTPVRSQTIRVGGTPVPVFSPPPPATPVARSEYAPPAPSVIQLAGQRPEPQRSQTIRVGTPANRDFGTTAPPPVPAPVPAQPVVPAPSIIQLPGHGPSFGPQTVRVASPAPSIPYFPESVIRLAEDDRRIPMRTHTVRVGSPPIQPASPSIIRLAEGDRRTPMRTHTVRVGSPPIQPASPSIIRLAEDGRRTPMRTHTVRVGSPPIQPASPSIIRLPGGRDVPERVPTSQLVRVGGGAVPQPPVIPTTAPSVAPPTEQIIRLPSTAPQPPVMPSYVRVGGGQPTVVAESRRESSPFHPIPTMIQLPSTQQHQPIKSPMVRVTAPSTGTPAPASIAPPLSHLIRLPGSPSPASPPPAFVRVPQDAPGGLTTVPGTVETPGGVVRVERRDRTPTIIQVASPGPGSRYVRATPSPGTAVPGFVRRAAATPGLSRVPEIVRVGQHTPVPGASRTSLDRPPSEEYPPHRPISITTVGREDIIAPVASRSSMAGRSIADNLDQMAREEEEEAEQRRRRRGAAGLPANAFDVFEDRESKRQRQFEEFLEAQRLENERLRETLFQMAPGHRRSGHVTEGDARVSDVINEAVETIKRDRDADRASIMSLRDDEIRRDLEEERTRVRELQGELARMQQLLDEERSRKDVRVEDKCAEMHDAVRANHEEVRVQLGDLANVMHECKDENARRAAEEERKWAEKEARRREKDDQQAQLQALLAKMAADQDEDRRIAEEERRRAAERPQLEEVIAQLRQQNAEQQQLLVTLLDEHRQHNAQQNHETIDAVRAAVAQHVPIDIKGHLNEFSKSLAEEVRLLLREVGKLREEKRNIQYEIGCMLCLKSKYGPGGEFDPEWRPTTGPLADGPPMPMPSAPGEEQPIGPPDVRPTTAPPAWRTIHQKRKPARKREAAPTPAPPPPMPSAPTPMPMPVHVPPTAPPQSMPPPSMMQPPPSMMDQGSRQQSWYAWQPDPRYAPSSPSSAPMYEVPESRPLGFFGPRSPRDAPM